jgi:large subunit ribosomal protein L7Ae
LEVGAVVGRRTSTVLAFGDVKSEDKAELVKLVSAIKANYENKISKTRNRWGGGHRDEKW